LISSCHNRKYPPPQDRCYDNHLYLRSNLESPHCRSSKTTTTITTAVKWKISQSSKTAACMILIICLVSRFLGSTIAFKSHHMKTRRFREINLVAITTITQRLFLLFISTAIHSAVRSKITLIKAVAHQRI